MEKLMNCAGLDVPFPKNLFRQAFLYADSADYRSFEIFKRNGVKSVKLYAAYRHAASDNYCLISCDVSKRETQAFLDSLAEVHRDLLIMGYRDYEWYCDEAFSALEQSGLECSNEPVERCP